MALQTIGGAGVLSAADSRPAVADLFNRCGRDDRSEDSSFARRPLSRGHARQRRAVFAGRLFAAHRNESAKTPRGLLLADFFVVSAGALAHALRGLCLWPSSTAVASDVTPSTAAKKAAVNRKESSFMGATNKLCLAVRRAGVGTGARPVTTPMLIVR